MQEVPDYYTGFTQAEVETIFAAHKSELTKMVSAFASGDQSVTKKAIAEVRLEIKGCQRALRRFDPETYGGRRRRTFTTRVAGRVPR